MHDHIDCQHRARSKALLRAFIAANEGDADLPSNDYLRAVQLLLYHTKIEDSIEVDVALAQRIESWTRVGELKNLTS